MPRKRTILYVTGTRAEYGLMRRTLFAIRESKKLELRIMAIGQHLDSSRGFTVDEICADGFAPIVAKRVSSSSTSIHTGQMFIDVAQAIESVQPQIALVTGDRVEALAAASAAHVAGVVVAHVHGGDRAQGQVDDSLRHAITKPSHIHFVATKGAAQRVAKLGEDRFRIHQVGAPGLDGIAEDASRGNSSTEPFILFSRHPFTSNEKLEARQTIEALDAITRAGAKQIIALWPNNDPGSSGIARALGKKSKSASIQIHRHLNRPDFLASLRDCVCLVGNSSAGIIEAGSFGTPVIDIGLRQNQREHGRNVTHVEDNPNAIERAARIILKNPERYRMKNPWGDGQAAKRIAQVLSNVKIEPRLTQKLITY